MANIFFLDSVAGTAAGRRRRLHGGNQGARMKQPRYQDNRKGYAKTRYRGLLQACGERRPDGLVV